MKVRNQSNYKEGKHSFERTIPGEVDITVPNESLSIRDLFDKYRKGGVVPSAKIREGNDQNIPDDADPENFHDMEKIASADLFDREDLKNAIALEVQEKRQKLNAMEKASNAKKIEKQKELDEMAEKFRHDKQTATKPQNKSSKADGTKEA